MAKAEQRHAHFIEKAHLLGEIGLRFTSILAAVCIIAAMIGGAIYAAITGHDALAYTIAAGGGISIVLAALLKPAFGKKRDEPPASPLPKKPPRKKGAR